MARRSTSDFRIEHDSMGDLQVPADALWGAQTQRAVQNFPISGQPMPRGFIRALGLIKAAAAEVNAGLGLLPKTQAAAIRSAALLVADGSHDAHFPIDVFQTGSGTSSNMNANEVIATLASRSGKKIHPNDHVNLGQSSNDVIPTAIRVSAQLAVVEDLLPSLKHLRRTIERRGKSLGKITKTGRTHLMDAMPLTFAQEFGAWAAQLASAEARIDGLAETPASAADRRHRDRHRHQCRSALRQADGEGVVDAGRNEVRVGRRQVRGHRHAG